MRTPPNTIECPHCTEILSRDGVRSYYCDKCGVLWRWNQLKEPEKRPRKYGFEATFLDGSKLKGISFNASTAAVELAKMRLDQGACTRRELAICSLVRVKELDVYELSPEPTEHIARAIETILDNWEIWDGEAMQQAQLYQDEEAWRHAMREHLRLALSEGRKESTD